MPEELPFDVNDPEYDDPIVAEVRAIRRQIMEEFGNDRAAYDRHLIAREREHPERMASLRPQRPRKGSRRTP